MNSFEFDSIIDLLLFLSIYLLLFVVNMIWQSSSVVRKAYNWWWWWGQMVLADHSNECFDLFHYSYCREGRKKTGRKSDEWCAGAVSREICNAISLNYTIKKKAPIPPTKKALFNNIRLKKSCILAENCEY